MKEHLWSNPKLEWEGFQPVSYWFDHKVWDLPLIEKSTNGGPDTLVTVGIVYQKLEGKELTKEFRSFGRIDTEIETNDGLKLVLTGADFNCRLLETMLSFRADGINPFNVVLFYYDKDSCREDPQHCFSFFVAHNDKIVRERLSFFDHSNSGFDPFMFATQDHSKSVWFDDPNWDEAQAKFWYRKFYSETRTGQLMLLRPDNPVLFFYEGRTAPDIMAGLSVIARSVNTVRLLLWVLVILAIISFILRWK